MVPTTGTDFYQFEEEDFIVTRFPIFKFGEPEKKGAGRGLVMTVDVTAQTCKSSTVLTDLNHGNGIRTDTPPRSVPAR